MSEQRPETTPPQPAPALSLWLLGGITALAVIFGLIGFAVSRNAPADDSTPNTSGAAIVDASLQSDGVVPRDPFVTLTDFTLTAQTGENLRLSDLAGQYVVVYFGYTFCPDFCPTTLLDYRLVQRALGDDLAEWVTFVMISVDPQRDTPEILDRYMSRFDPSFVGLTGTQEDLRAVADQFGAFFQSHDTGESPYYMIDHSATKYLIDPQGRIVAEYRYGTSVDTITRDLRTRLGG